MELPVLVLSEQRGSDAGKSIGFAQPQSFLESVIQLDLAATTNDKDSTRSED